jgi:hypothetical protein
MPLAIKRIKRDTRNDVRAIAGHVRNRCAVQNADDLALQLLQ